MKLSYIPSALLVAATFSLSTAYAGEIQVKDGQTVGFLGDSITAAGARPGGYCNLLIQALKAEGITAKPIYKGIGGHKSNQMLKRVDKDILQHEPDWMTLSCGVNDVWHGKNGVNLEDYKKNMTAIVMLWQL